MQASWSALPSWAEMSVPVTKDSMVTQLLLILNYYQSGGLHNHSNFAFHNVSPGCLHKCMLPLLKGDGENCCGKGTSCGQCSFEHSPFSGTQFSFTQSKVVSFSYTCWLILSITSLTFNLLNR